MIDSLPGDPDFAERAKNSLLQQQVMQTIGAELVHISAGKVQIRLPFRLDLTQQNGFVHAGIITTIVDSACGYASYTLMPPESGVLTVEYKVNFLRPAQGDYFVATGEVIKPGRTLSVCEGRVVAYREESEKLIALMQATMMCVMPE